MGLKETSEQIVMYLESETDYSKRVFFVQTKIREIIESGNRERESIPDNRSDDRRNSENDAKENDSRTI